MCVCADLILFPFCHFKLILEVAADVWVIPRIDRMQWSDVTPLPI